MTWLRFRLPKNRILYGLKSFLSTIVGRGTSKRRYALAPLRQAETYDGLTFAQDQKDFFDNLDIETQGFRVYLTSKRRVRRLMRIVVILSSCLLLLVPITLLYLLKSDVAKLVMIIVTVLLFTTVTSAITSARVWEVVAASTAYVTV